jgi:hypothetical protein
MKQETFLESMTLFEAMYNEAYKNEIKKFMWGRFKQYPEELWNEAVEKITDTFKPTARVPLPSIPDYLAVLEISGDDKAIQAMQLLKKSAGHNGRYQSIDFGDMSLHVTIDAYGGWIEVAGWGDKEWGFNEKKFLAMYKSFSKIKNLKGPHHLIGIHEETNLKNGFASSIPQPTKIQLPWSKFGGVIEFKVPEEPRTGELTRIGDNNE